MMTAPHLEMIRTRLRDKMLARLALRWKEANTYIPPGSAKVHCAKPLPVDDQEGFDMYVLAYQDAIEDVLDMLDRSSDKPERPHALVMAEASVFQGGALPRQAVGRAVRKTQHRKEPAKGRERPDHRRTETNESKQARRELEKLFSGGGQ